MTAQEARQACLEAADMARVNAKVCRAHGDEAAAKEAEKRAEWYTDLAKRREERR